MTPNQTVETYTVPGMGCGHCVTALSEEVERVAGVESVELETEQVTVRGRGFHDHAVRAAIDEAGYEAAA